MLVLRSLLQFRILRTCLQLFCCCRLKFDSFLYVILADVSTDGHWCFVVFWVVPRSSSIKIRWASLKNRLMSICPSSYSTPFYPDISQPGPSQFYLLKLLSPDRKGLLHGNYLFIHAS